MFSISFARRIARAGLVPSSPFMFAVSLLAAAVAAAPLTARADPTITWNTAYLSLPRSGSLAVASGNTIYIAGGTTWSNIQPTSSPQVDIYHAATNTWTEAGLQGGEGPPLAGAAAGNTVLIAGESSFADLFDSTTGAHQRITVPQGRLRMGGASTGNDIFLAGGLDPTTFAYSARVDVWDAAANTWSTAQLSSARSQITAIGAGGDVIFAGGVGDTGPGYSNAVDIYHSASGTWTTAKLSQGRYGIAAAAVGNLVFFAGGQTSAYTGFTNAVDIYNTTTDTWSTATLSSARGYAAAVALGDDVFFAGGYNGFSYSNVIDVYDTVTGAWSTATLSQARDGIAAAAVGNTAVFAGGYTGYDSNSGNGGYSSIIDVATLTPEPGALLALAAALPVTLLTRSRRRRTVRPSGE